MTTFDLTTHRELLWRIQDHYSGLVLLIIIFGPRTYSIGTIAFLWDRGHINLVTSSAVNKPNMKFRPFKTLMRGRIIFLSSNIWQRRMIELNPVKRKISPRGHFLSATRLRPDPLAVPVWRSLSRMIIAFLNSWYSNGYGDHEV